MKKLLIVSALLLSACSGGEVKETLGLNRSTPDEFRVVSRPPLSVPPDFTLRPPLPGVSEAPSATGDDARDLLLGRGGNGAGMADTAVGVVTSDPLPSGADAQFLQRAGAQAADPQVRAKLTQEELAEQEAREKKEDSLLGGVLPVFDPKAKEPVVDAKGERERIQEQKKDNKPITGEGTKEIDPKKKGILGGF